MCRCIDNYGIIAAYLKSLLSSESDSDDVEEMIATIFPRQVPKSGYFLQKTIENFKINSV